MPHMEGIFVNGEKAKFHPEDILDTDASQYTEEIGESVTAYLTEHITNPSNPPIDTSLSIAGAAADAKETGDKISELKEDFVQSQQPIYSKNRFDPSNVQPGYVNQVTGAWEPGSSTYSGTPDMVDVLESPFTLALYPFAGASSIGMRYAVYNAIGEYITGALLDSSDFTIVDDPTTNSSKIGYISFTNPNIRFIRFSMIAGYFNTIKVQIAKGTTPTDYTKYTGDHDFACGIPSLNSCVVGKNSKTAYADTLISGSQLNLCLANSIKKNKVYHFHANINNAFSSVYFGHGESSYSLYFKIDNTNISFMSNGNVGSELPHGLTLDTYIDLIAIVGENNTGTLIFNTLGGTYTRSVQIVNGCKGDIFARPSGCTITKVYIEFTSADFRQPIWIFGDSYVTHTSDTRWPYWLIEWGFGRCLLNGFPGENSEEALSQAVSYLPSAGIPKYIVWCLGMNDPDNGAINASWLSNVTNLISECEKYKVIPILATIPNVPSYDHSYKNAWVKQSGYRYIDFAKAVNAESTGATWYTGALSSDNTHPSEIGARLLCEQVILDVPELMLGNI